MLASSGVDVGVRASIVPIQITKIGVKQYNIIVSYTESLWISLKYLDFF
jgi:hypothetical protein